MKYGIKYTVKWAQVKMPAKAAGEYFRKYSYLLVQVKVFAGCAYLRFPQLNRGNLPAAFQVIYPEISEKLL